MFSVFWSLKNECIEVSSIWRHLVNDMYLICVNINENEETRGRGVIKWTGV